MPTIMVTRIWHPGPCRVLGHAGDGDANEIRYPRWRIDGHSLIHCNTCYEEWKAERCSEGVNVLERSRKPGITPSGGHDRTTLCPCCHGLRYFNGSRDACPN